MPPQQKALLLSSKGAPFGIGTIDVPSPGSGEILIKVEATGLNPADYFIQMSGLYIKTWPTILGIDGAGIVAAVGEGVTQFAVGDRVAFAPEGFEPKSFSTHQQYAIALPDLAVKIPDNISLDQGAAISCTLATAVIGLFNPYDTSSSVGLTPPWEEEGAGKYAGKPVIIFGGATSVGQYAIQLCRLAGFSPLITTASLRNAEYLKSLGTTHIIDRNLAGAELKAAIKEITTTPIEVIYDTVGGFSPEVKLVAYEILAPGGTMATVDPHGIPAEKKREDKRTVWPWGSYGPPGNRKVGQSLHSRLPKLLEEGIIKPTPVEVIPNGLAGITDGLERLKAGKVSACKLVARPPETP